MYNVYEELSKIYDKILLKVALNTIKQPFQNLWYRWNIVESGIKHHNPTQPKYIVVHAHYFLHRI